MVWRKIKQVGGIECVSFGREAIILNGTVQEGLPEDSHFVEGDEEASVKRSEGVFSAENSKCGGFVVAKVGWPCGLCDLWN